MMCQKVQTLIRRCVGDGVAGLGLHFLHMSQGPFSRDVGHIVVYRKQTAVNLFPRKCLGIDGTPKCLVQFVDKLKTIVSP